MLSSPPIATSRSLHSRCSIIVRFIQIKGVVLGAHYVRITSGRITSYHRLSMIIQINTTVPPQIEKANQKLMHKRVKKSRERSLFRQLKISFQLPSFPPFSNEECVHIAYYERTGQSVSLKPFICLAQPDLLLTRADALKTDRLQVVHEFSKTGRVLINEDLLKGRRLLCKQMIAAQPLISCR